MVPTTHRATVAQQLQVPETWFPPFLPPSYSADKVAAGAADSSSWGSSGTIPVFSVLRPSALASLCASSRPSGVSAYLGGGGYNFTFFIPGKLCCPKLGEHYPPWYPYLLSPSLRPAISGPADCCLSFAMHVLQLLLPISLRTILSP